MAKTNQASSGKSSPTVPLNTPDHGFYDDEPKTVTIELHMSTNMRSELEADAILRDTSLEEFLLDAAEYFSRKLASDRLLAQTDSSLNQ